MAILGTSPLGLTTDSSSTNTNDIGTYERGKILDDASLYKSIFQNNAFNTSANFNTDADTRDNTDDSYDISVSSILDYTNTYPSMRLLASDFAYLKYLGVYPNNRLVVARRFPAGVPNDLTTISATPLSTLISWIPDGNDFITMSYGEHWVEADASFTAILNEVGKDLTTTNIGNVGAGGGGLIPLPGFMEGLQYDVMKRMGIVDDASQIPAGNPNLIREAMMRKTMKDGEAGSGLKCEFEIKINVVYEQKFINNVDPTLVYFDIVANLLSFGTSNSYFQFNNKFGKGVSSIITDLISGDVVKITNAIGKFVTEFVDAIRGFVKDLITKISNVVKTSSVATELVAPVIKKYKIRLIGVANALTGTTSTPWHVTIGNPKRPMFSSGDMQVMDVKLTMGDTLSYNDLPSTITAEITFKNARSLGGDEIYERFNNGVGRSSKRINLSVVEYTHNDVEIDKDGKSKIYTSMERENPNKQQERGILEPISTLKPIGINNQSGKIGTVSSGILTAPNNITPISTSIPTIPPSIPSAYKWEALVADSAGRISVFDGISKSEDEAQKKIKGFLDATIFSSDTLVSSSVTKK
jgi:hypothetical protein